MSVARPTHRLFQEATLKFSLILAGAALVGALLARPATPCTLTLVPDQVRGVAYHVLLNVSPTCPAETTFRVRKSSTINTKRNGAPYQPIKPLQGAWELGTVLASCWRRVKSC